MICKKCLLVLTYISITLVHAQLGPTSLQAAVDALHRREAELAFRYHNDPQRNENFQQDENYLNEEQEALRYQQLNRLLTQYLDHEEEMNENANFRDDEYGPDERKRSVFRERDEASYPNPSVFREREVDYLSQPDMAEEFLEEIEQERAMNRENNYREALAHLWEKYQQQENEIKQELESEREHNLPAFYGNPIAEKKRTLPILPWLPASRKKRFPVAKRSPVYKESSDKMLASKEKVAKDLQVIFGESSEKKKRSSGAETAKVTEHKRDISTQKTDEAVKSHAVEGESKSPSHDQMFAGHEHGHSHEHGEHSDEHDDHSHEHDDHSHEHDDGSHEHEDHHDGSFDDEDDEIDDRKKRAVESNKRSNPEVFKEDQIIPGDISDSKQKKSIEWSKYFGMNRRKKSDEWGPTKSFSSSKVEDPSKESTRNNEELLDSVDSKLKAIEDMIIEQAVKYTGAHDGIVSSDEIRQLKDHVISRLATAYSIEKMRRAIEKIKQHAEVERHLKMNEIEEAQNEELGKDKRVAIKKEKAEFDNNNLLIEAATDKKPIEHTENNLGNSDDEDNKKKRNSNHNELINDLFGFDEEMGVFGPTKCPILKVLERRCLGVDILNGDVHQDLLPVCEVHQLCYLCGTSQSSCDFQYLAEADAMCNHNPECQTAARSALMILRGSPNPQLGPRECAKNPCLYRALKNIGL